MILALNRKCDATDILANGDGDRRRSRRRRQARRTTARRAGSAGARIQRWPTSLALCPTVGTADDPRVCTGGTPLLTNVTADPRTLFASTQNPRAGYALRKG